MVIAILVGFLASQLIFLAWVARKMLDFERKLEELKRVGVLITGDQHTVTAASQLSRREMIRRIERHTATHKEVAS